MDVEGGHLPDLAEVAADEIGGVGLIKPDGGAKVKRGENDEQ